MVYVESNVVALNSLFIIYTTFIKRSMHNQNALMR